MQETFTVTVTAPDGTREIREAVEFVLDYPDNYPAGLDITEWGVLVSPAAGTAAFEGWSATDLRTLIVTAGEIASHYGTGTDGLDGDGVLSTRQRSVLDRAGRDYDAGMRGEPLPEDRLDDGQALEHIASVTAPGLPRDLALARAMLAEIAGVLRRNERTEEST